MTNRYPEVAIEALMVERTEQQYLLFTHCLDLDLNGLLTRRKF